MCSCSRLLLKDLDWLLLEAMACGLPAIASEASIGPEVITAECGFISPAGDLDRLVELLRWFDRTPRRTTSHGPRGKGKSRALDMEQLS